MKTALTVCALLACQPLQAIAEDDERFKMPKAHFEQTVRTLAIAPVSLPAGTPDATNARQRIERLLTVELERRGYGVVASPVFIRLWRDLSGKLGGVFDPVSGTRIDDRWKLAFDYTARELKSGYQVDAILFPSVIIGEVTVSSLEAIPPAMRAQSEIQLALGTHLRVTIRDLNAARMYQWSSAMEVTEVFAGRSHEKRPASELYRLDDKLERAVARVLRDLPERSE